MSDTFEFGDVPKPTKSMTVRLKQMGITDPTDLVQGYLQRQQKRENKILQLKQIKQVANAEILRRLK